MSGNPRLPQLLITFDPGSITGWAVFIKRTLVLCGYDRFTESFLEQPVWNKSCRGGVVQIEYPIAYPGARSKTDPNDLIRNAWRGGELANMYRRLGMTVEEVYPVQWKGGTSKEITQERVLEQVTEQEKALILQSKSSRARKLDHNMIDAIGAGMWRLQRWNNVQL